MNMRLATLALVLGVVYASLSAQPIVTPLLVEGQQAPLMAPGSLVARARTPFLADGGFLGYRADFDLDSNGNYDSTAFYMGHPGSVQLVVQDGDPVPGLDNGALIKTSEHPWVFRDGTAAIMLVWDDPDTGTEEKGVFAGRPGALLPLVRGGGEAPGFGAETLVLNVYDAAFTSTGFGVAVATWFHLPDPVNPPTPLTHYWIGPDGARPIVTYGDMVSSSFGPREVMHAMGRVASDGIGLMQVLYEDSLTGVEWGLWRFDGDGLIEEIIVSDSAVEWFGESANLDQENQGKLSFHLNASGEFAFVGHVVGDGDLAEGVIACVGYFDGRLQALLAVDQEVEIAGETYTIGSIHSSVGVRAITPAGRVIVGVTIDGPGVDFTNNFCLFVVDGGEPVLMARKGSTLPGSHDEQVIEGVGTVSSDRSGNLLASFATARVQPPSGFTPDGLWMFPIDGDPYPLLRPGDEVRVGAAGEAKLVRTTHIPGDFRYWSYRWMVGGNGESSFLDVVAANGVVVSHVTFEDDTTASVAIRVGPACRGDVTTQGPAIGEPGYGEPDGLTTAADIAYFVNAWIVDDVSVSDVTTVNAQEGDFYYGAEDGLVTYADLSFFVNYWFAGCS